jgi:hypothetical protein
MKVMMAYNRDIISPYDIFCLRALPKREHISRIVFSLPIGCREIVYRDGHCLDDSGGMGVVRPEMVAGTGQ